MPDNLTHLIELLAIAYTGDPEWMDMMHEQRQEVLRKMTRAFEALQTYVMSLPETAFDPVTQATTPTPEDPPHA
jgi:hypothetical protein